MRKSDGSVERLEEPGRSLFDVVKSFTARSRSSRSKTQSSLARSRVRHPSSLKKAGEEPFHQSRTGLACDSAYADAKAERSSSPKDRIGSYLRRFQTGIFIPPTDIGKALSATYDLYPKEFFDDSDEWRLMRPVSVLLTIGIRPCTPWQAAPRWPRRGGCVRHAGFPDGSRRRLVSSLVLGGKPVQAGDKRHGRCALVSARGPRSP